jgi:short-subunit dehydrogenase
MISALYGDKNDTFQWENRMPKKILITGASSGIGRALADELADRGYSIALTARRMETLEEIRDTLQSKHPSATFVAHPLDVVAYDSVPEQISACVERLGGLDILFANAGIGLGEKVGTSRFSEARRTIETNLLGAMATVDAAVRYFLEKGQGHIVGTCSVAAFRGMPRSSSYGASKAGFALYLESLRAEVIRKNIHVTVLYPGYIDTPLNDMLPNRPFLISAEKGAAMIADMIERKVTSSTVPVWPWCLLGWLLKRLPTRVVARL